MNDIRTTQRMDPPRRLGTRRRAASALVANYIHELSDRHGGPRPQATLAEQRQSETEPAEAEPAYSEAA